MIDPITTNTVRVGELPNEPFSLSDKIPHEVGIDLKSGTVQQLVDLVANVLDTTGGVGFRAVSVTDGQTLPTTTTQEFILLGKGTYYNVSGGDTITLTKELNAIVSNGSFWFIGVEIDINAEDLGIVQTIRQGFLETTPSENAIYNAIAVIDSSVLHKTGNLNESIDGRKNITNTVFPRNNFFTFRNNYNSASNNRTVENSPLNIYNAGSGIGFHFDNASTGFGIYGFNQSTGTLLHLDSKTGSNGDLIQFSKNEITTGGVKNDGSLYSSYGTFGTTLNTSLPQLTVRNGSNPSVIEFPKNGFNMRGTVGALGSYEMNMSTNMDYTSSPGVHRFYDNTKPATWLAIGDAFWQMQAAPASTGAGDVWNNAGQPRPLYQRTDTGFLRVNTTAPLSSPATIGDAMFAVRRNASFASIGGETDLVIEGAKTKGVSSLIFLNAYNNGNVIVVSGGGRALFGTTSDNGQGVIQANGNITANPAALSNQVVVKSQLDSVANLATSASYTPTLTANGNITSLALQSATWTKIGNIVTCQIIATGSITASPANTSFIATLPFNRLAALKTVGVSSLIDNSSTPTGSGIGITQANATQAIFNVNYGGSTTGTGRTFIMNLTYDITQ